MVVSLIGDFDSIHSGDNQHITDSSSIPPGSIPTTNTLIPPLDIST